MSGFYDDDPFGPAFTPVVKPPSGPQGFGGVSTSPAPMAPKPVTPTAVAPTPFGDFGGPAFGPQGDGFG
jgi:hypothetical protein